MSTNDITPQPLTNSRPEQDLKALSLLRAQFEPMLLTFGGFVADAGRCREAWDAAMRNDRGWDFPRQVAIATEWLSLCQMTKTMRPGSNSYGLKHEAERWGRRVKGYGVDGYVSNGALIMAAVRLGFTLTREPSRPDYPNAWMNIGRRRPDGRVAVRVFGRLVWREPEDMHRDVGP